MPAVGCPKVLAIAVDDLAINFEIRDGLSVQHGLWVQEFFVDDLNNGVRETQTLEIRPFRWGDERPLHAVFMSAVHGLACNNYTPEQCHAWAPPDLDQAMWARRMQGNRPFVVEVNGEIAAYADVQSNGYIDQFFVAAAFARRGLGRTLMKHIHGIARARAITDLTADVSRTAQPFFETFGFVVVEQRAPIRHGVVIPNALMRKHLKPDGHHDEVIRTA